jgi:hypothetical protein
MIARSDRVAVVTGLVRLRLFRSDPFEWLLTSGAYVGLGSRAPVRFAASNGCNPSEAVTRR